MLNIANIRLFNQQIHSSEFQDSKALVAYMGAMQAQDYALAKWAVGLRVNGATHDSIQLALDKGEIIRTHVLRPTWHFIATEDAHWMLALTAPHIKVSMGSMNKQLELDTSIFNKCNDIIEKILTNGNHLTREEIMVQIAESGIMVSPLRAAHLMMYAELDGIACNGIMKGKQHTYALLDEKPFKKVVIFSREEALATLAKRFFISHGPATLQDFYWWSGLPMGDVRKGLEAIKNELISEIFDNQTYWFSHNTNFTEEESIHFLPSFDEFMVSYKDRSASIEAHLKAQAMTSNGIFKPIIVVNGKVIGIWKRTIKKEKLLIEPQFFYPDNTLSKDVMMKATEGLGKFWNLGVEIL
jgi:hypothetical protein